MIKDAFNLRVPFFIPLWRRVAATVFLFVWTLVEFGYLGEPLWGMIPAVAGAMALWQFFLTGWPASESESAEESKKK